MSKVTRVFWACAAGAGIGALIALEINSYFWWLGLIIGGVFGYLLYDIKAVARAVPRAWCAASGWKLDGEAWKIRGLVTLAFVSVLASALLAILVGSFLGGRIDHVSTWEFVFAHKISVMALLVFLSMAVPAALAIGVSGFSYALALSVVSLLSREDDIMRDFRSIIKFGNPVAVFVYWPIVILRHSPAAVWRAAIAVGLFIKYLFLAIHSDERLLCGIDAAIGALAGGAFGVANYEIVSKRILGLEQSA